LFDGCEGVLVEEAWFIRDFEVARVPERITADVVVVWFSTAVVVVGTPDLGTQAAATMARTSATMRVLTAMP
jgi:hypothetical protein